MLLRSASVVLGLWVSVACSSEPSSGNAAGNGSAAGSSAAAAAAGQAGTSGGNGTMQAGASGGGIVLPSGGSAGLPGAGGTAGGAGVGVGGAVAAGAGGALGGGATGGSATGGGVSAGCANHDYDLCLDFESGIDKAKWSGGTDSAITMADSAHGGHGYRLYPMGGALLKATNLGKITNQMWGRFYVHFKPGAPGGHGNIVAAFDQANNWYEMGWQFDAMMGVWHAASNAERPLRSKPFIVDQWYCVETFFDGTKTEMPKWWIDGKEAEYYMAANEMLIPKTLTQFARVEVGFTPYAGLGLQMPDGKGPKDDRVLTDMTIDDIAFDKERIGCITP